MTNLPTASVRADLVLDKLIEKNSQIERLQFAVRKLAGWQGVSIADLIEDEYLQEGDMD